jgi:hypothetical protein
MEETTEEAGGASTSSRTLTKSWDLRIWVAAFVGFR